MKKLLSYAGLLVLAGIIFGAIVTGLVWMQHLYDLSVSYYLFTAAFWLGMAATVLFGIWLRRYYQQISKVWVFFSVLTALFGAYLFPKFLTPTCSEIPTVKAGCETVCVGVCTWWVPPGTVYTNSEGEEETCTSSPTNIGCCIRYGESCTTECTWYPPTVTGHTTCATFGNDGWCVENGQLHMSGTDPEGLTITISGTMVGQPFSCTPGYSCVRTLFEGNGDAIFHSYNGHLSSGNFSVAYKYDATPPTLTPSVTGTSGSNGWYTSVVSVATGATDSASGVANSQIRLLSGTWENSIDFTTEGTHSFEMSALDVAGNEATQQAQVMVDTVPPVQEIGITSGTLGTDGYYISDVTITATSGDATSGVDTVVYRDNGGAWQTGTSVTLTTDGSHTIEFLTTDVAGLTDSDSITVLIDQTNPAITISPSGTLGLVGWYVSNVHVDITATDDTSGLALLEYSVDGSVWANWVSTITLTDGYHAVDAYAEDHASNYAMENMIINVDTLPPVPDVQAIADAGINDWYRSDVNWQATATDATSTVASIEVNADASGWNLGNTAFFTNEGPHTVDFRFTDVAGNDIVTNHAFSIDKTAPTINIDNPMDGNMVSRIVTVSGTATDTLSGLMEVAVSPDGGATWHIVPWQADGSWQYDWDTTSGPNGVFALIARATDEAGNVTTDQVNVIVDNAPPSVSITESWDIWDTARASVHSNVIPVGSIHLTVECGDQPDRTYDYNSNTNTFDFKWDRRCGDGNLAPSGTYTVVLEACDIYNNCDEARGKVDIPFVAFIAPPTSTPMPTEVETETEQIWYSTPTPVPSFTPTPQDEQLFPVLPATGGDDSGDGNVPTGSNQPLLPLTAAALGTSVLLAASSRREEREAQAAARLGDMQNASTAQQDQDLADRKASVAAQTVATVNEETPYVEVSTLAALAGVVKETFTGVWEDAIRISAADAPITIVTHNWVNGVDPEKRLQEIAENDAFIEWYYFNRYLPQKEREESLKALEEQKRIAAEKYERDRADERAEQAARTKANYAASIAAYQEQKEKEAKEYSNQVKAFHEAEDKENEKYVQSIYQGFINKESTAQEEIDAYKEQQRKEMVNSYTVPEYMKTAYLGTAPTGESVFTPDEELREVIDANIAKQVADKPTMKDILVNFLNSASAFAGKVYDEARKPAEIKNYKENSGPVPASFGGAPGSYNITYDGNPFGGYSVEQVKSEYHGEISDAAAEFILSMIPILGDGSGIIKELYNKFMTGEMDELNFTLSVVGLVMDLPFDAGILGDTAVATLKAASTMIPSGPARQVMLEALQQVGKNPEGLIAMAGAFGKMAGKDDLMKIITSNEEVFRAYLNGGSEFAENLVKYEDEILQAGKAMVADELIDIMEGGKGVINSTDEVVEVGVKAASSTDEVVEAGVKAASSTDEAVEAGVKALTKSSDEVAEAGAKAAANATTEAAEAGGKGFVYNGGEAVEAGGKTVANATTEAAEAGGKVAANTADEAADILTDGSQLVKNAKGKVVGLEPNVTYKTGEFDYLYKTDDMGRISQVNVDDLKLSDTPRATHNPKTPGKVTGQDHAGHLIADRFGGSPEIDNLISQLSGDNLSAYRILENKWATALHNKQLVEVKIDLIYTGTEVRPTKYIVEYKIDGDPIKRTFNN